MLDHISLFTFAVEGLFIVTAAFGLFMFWRRLRQQDVLISQIEDVLDMPGRGIILYDNDDRLIRANAQATKFLLSGREISSGVPRTFKAFLNYIFDHAAEIDESLRNTLKKAPPHAAGAGFREVIVWGEDKLCLVEAYPTSGKRHMVALYDLSKAKSDEDEAIKFVRYSNKLGHAIEAATNGIVVARFSDGEYKIVFANKAFYTQSKLADENVLGREARQVFNEFIHDEKHLERLSIALIDSKQSDLEISIERDDGPQWFNIKIMPDKIGGEDVFIAVFSDITDLKIREGELLRTQKMEALGQLAAGVAHDFNNILSIIGGYSRMVDKHFGPDETLSDYMDKIQKATERGAKLSSQLLTFSRHKIVTEEVIDLSHVVEEQLGMLTPLFPATISVNFQVDDEGLMVECGMDNITQITMNLALNARDAMPDGGTLTIGARLCEDENIPASVRHKLINGTTKLACLYIKDTGSGMDEATLAKIFDPFFTTKDQGKGTGLGLFMVYGLVKQAGGYIHVESVPDKGTVFEVYWPLSHKKPSKVISGSLDDIMSIRMDGYTVLVAEDEPDLLTLVTDMLERMGVKVLSAANGNEALLMQHEYEGQIDLLLADVVMPELGGVKLAELMKEERPDIRTMFMSGYPAGAREIKTTLPQEATFIAKPINYERMAQIIFQKLKNRNDDVISESKNVSVARWQ